MDLEFHKLSITEFKCFRNDEKIDFSDLPIGLHFVRGENLVEPALGSNGSGKSSLWDGLCWCLFGKTTTGLRNPDVIPWNARDKTRVKLTLTRDGKPYEILRVTPNNSLTLNGETVGQEQINQELMSFPVFVNTLLLGQGQPLFFDLTPQGKMDLFVDVLDLDRWDMRSKKALNEVKRLTDYETALQAKIDATEASLEKFRSLRHDLIRQREDWEMERSRQLGLLKLKIKDLKQQSSHLSDLKQDLIDNGEKLRKEIALTKQRLDEHSGELRDLELSYREVLALKGKAKIELSKLESAKGKICPTCGQKVEQGHLDKHRAELKSVIEDPRIGLIADDVTAAKDLVDGTKSIFDEDKLKLEKIMLETHRLEVEYTRATTSLEETQQSLNHFSEDENPYLSQLRSIRADIKSQKDTMVDYQEELKRLRRRIERVRFWVAGFKACRLYLLEEILSELQMVTNAICPELGLENWYIDYQVEKETKSGTVRRGLVVTITSSTSDRPVRWESFSGGEQQRLRLVGALALSEVLLNHAGIRSDWMVLDEPTRHLSIEGIQDLCESLPNYAARLGRKIFYVDHHSIESPNFSSVFIVKRDISGVVVEIRK